MSVSRIITKEIHVKNGETVHISCLSDLHIESSLSRISELNSLMKRRSGSLNKHSAIIIGDVLDLIGNQDLKRYRPSVHNPRLHGVDAWLDEAVEYAVEQMESWNTDIDMISPGNHEDEFLKRHGIDVTSVLANRLKASRGGYSGLIDYRFVFDHETGNSRAKSARFRVAYHHGAWGGKHAKGYLGAKEWFMRMPEWHVAVYGHCHSGRVDYESVFTVKGGSLVPKDVYLVNCSSWVAGMDINDGRHTHYAERRGYPNQPSRSPLIRVTPRVTTGGRTRIDYSVEV